MKKSFFLFVSFTLFNYSYATCPNPLYEAAVPGNNPKLSQSNLKLSLQKVINRLTPGKNDLTNPVINAAKIRPLIHSYFHQDQGHTKTLHICFNPGAINKLAEDAGMQLWSTTRPQLLTWVTYYDHQNSETLIDPRTTPEVRIAIENAAAKKGLKLIFPNIDYHQAYNSMKNTDGNPLLALVKIAKPSISEAVLHITFNRNNPPYVWEGWQAYYRHNISSSYINKRTKPDFAGQYSLAGVSDFLFKQDTIKSIIKTTSYVRIYNIQTIQSYNKMNVFFKKIPGVSRSYVNSVTADTVLYTIEIVIPLRLIVRRLTQEFEPLPNDLEEGILKYLFKDNVKTNT